MKNNSADLPNDPAPKKKRVRKVPVSLPATRKPRKKKNVLGDSLASVEIIEARAALRRNENLEVMWVRFNNGDVCIAGIRPQDLDSNSSNLTIELPLQYMYKKKDGVPILMGVRDWFSDAGWNMSVVRSSIQMFIPVNESDRDRWTSIWTIRFTIATNPELHNDLSTKMTHREKSYSQVINEYQQNGKMGSRVYELSDMQIPTDFDDETENVEESD